MRSRGIRISDKHGVNPSVGLCFYCNDQNGEVILAGRLPGDVEAPRQAVWDMEPCEGCKNLMQAGIMLISIRDGEEADNPYRTGRMVVIKEEAYQRLVDAGAARAEVLESRVCFVEDSTWTALGLPEEPSATDGAD